MTREEAMDLVESAFDVWEDKYSVGNDMNREHKARDMAIKALKQQPCEDCISRQDVLDFMNFEDKWLTDAKSHNRDTEIAFSTLKSKISKMSSVIPKGVTVTDFADKCRECGRLKKGKWTRKAHGFPPEPYTACSNCDYDIDFEISKLVKADAFTIEPYRPNYCPNCGAKMEVEE